VITVVKVLLLTLILAASTVLAQKDETPKAILFADFGKIGVKEIEKKLRSYETRSRSVRDETLRSTCG
jgi:hypothetical protein